MEALRPHARKADPVREFAFRRGWLLVLVCACGGVYVDGSLPTTIPSITSLIAAPDALDAGGGNSLLSWAVVNEETLYLAPDAGDVTGLTAWEVDLTETTTYTLTAANSLGYTQSQVTVTVGP